MINSLEYKQIEEKWFDSKRFKKRRSKYLIKFVRGIEPGSKNYGIKGEGKRFIRVNDIGSNNKENVYINLETDSICNKEDILLCLDGSPGIVVSGFEGIFSTGLRKLELKDKELDYNYLFYSLNCDFSQECISFFSKGTTIIHSSDSTNYLKQPLPPKEEQLIISDYLDEATKKLNKVIENKKRQIELLKENEKGVVDIALKQGIDNQIEYKKTNIEWFNKIPKYWSVKKIKQISKFKPDSIKTGPFGSQLKRSDYLEQGEYKVYTQENIIKDNFSLGENFISAQKFNELQSFELEIGDIALTTRGTIGKASIVPENIRKGVMHPCLLRVQVNEDLVDKNYLLYFFNLSSIFVNEIFFRTNSTVLDVIYQETIKSTKLPVPPLEQQRGIVKYLNEKTSKNQESIDIIQSEISKLEEYKKILINDAVTGKMRVTA